MNPLYELTTMDRLKKNDIFHYHTRFPIHVLDVQRKNNEIYFKTKHQRHYINMPSNTLIFRKL